MNILNSLLNVFIGLFLVYLTVIIFQFSSEYSFVLDFIQREDYSLWLRYLVFTLLELLLISLLYVPVVIIILKLKSTQQTTSYFLNIWVVQAPIIVITLLMNFRGAVSLFDLTPYAISSNLVSFYIMFGLSVLFYALKSSAISTSTYKI